MKTGTKNNYFEVLRSGTNTTYQDLGRKNLNHIGIPFSGAMDNRSYQIANSLVNSNYKTTLEFAYQGPLLKFNGEKTTFAITGNVNFNIIRESNTEIGKCYQTYTITNGDQINIISTNNSVYGYLALEGGFETEKFFGSSSTNTNAVVGGNNGKKISKGNKLIISKIKNIYPNKKINFINSKIEFIRVIKGTNYDYFSDSAKNIFLSKEFKISKLTDRMGMRLEGPHLENIKNTNIKSEGIVKGVIQVPADGSPIIMLSDHGTIGGYPKIANIISADYDKVVQLFPGSKIKFKEINLKEAENLYSLYNLETKNLINQIN